MQPARWLRAEFVRRYVGDTQPAWVSDQDWQIFELGRAGKTQRQAAEELGVSLQECQRMIAHAHVNIVRHLERDKQVTRALRAE